jgi:hypothetical protein
VEIDMFGMTSVCLHLRNHSFAVRHVCWMECSTEDRIFGI